MARRPLTTAMGTLKGLLDRHAFLSANMLSTVADIPQVRLAASLRGDFYLGSEREAELLTLANRCVRVLEAILPLRIAPGDGATLRLLANNGRDPEEIRTLAMMLVEPEPSMLVEPEPS